MWWWAHTCQTLACLIPNHPGSLKSNPTRIFCCVWLCTAALYSAPASKCNEVGCSMGIHRFCKTQIMDVTCFACLPRRVLCHLYAFRVQGSSHHFSLLLGRTCFSKVQFHLSHLRFEAPALLRPWFRTDCSAKVSMRSSMTTSTAQRPCLYPRSAISCTSS